MSVRYIKRYLSSRIGTRVVVIYFGSRNRKEKYEGILYKVYNNIFTIIINNNEIKCFNIIDILTKTIHLYI